MNAAERLITYSAPKLYVVSLASYNLMSIEILEERARAGVARLESCDICPSLCGVNHLQDERGFCRTGRQARVNSFAHHFGEEPPLVGRSGSGTIFFSRLQSILRLLPELRDQPARSRARGFGRCPGPHDAGTAAQRLPQHQLRNSYACRSADPGGAGAGQSGGAAHSSGLQQWRIRLCGDAAAFGRHF